MKWNIFVPGTVCISVGDVSNLCTSFILLDQLDFIWIKIVLSRSLIKELILQLRHAHSSGSSLFPSDIRPKR